MVRPPDIKFNVKANPNHPAGENAILFEGKKLLITTDDFKVSWKLLSRPHTIWSWDKNQPNAFCKWYGMESIHEPVGCWIPEEHIPIGGMYIAIRSLKSAIYWYNYVHVVDKDARRRIEEWKTPYDWVIPIWQKCAPGYLVMGMNDVYGKYDDNIGEIEVELKFITEIELWDGKIESLKKLLPDLNEEELDLSIDKVPRAEGSIVQTRLL